MTNKLKEYFPMIRTRKEIFNPELYPERLEALLSLLLETEVKIKRVLPNDSVRFAVQILLERYAYSEIVGTFILI